MRTIVLFFTIIVQLCNVLEIAIIVEVFLSLFLMGKKNKVLYFVRAVTNPIVIPFKKVQGKFFKNLSVDFSPFFALILISLVRRIIINLIV